MKDLHWFQTKYVITPKKITQLVVWPLGKEYPASMIIPFRGLEDIITVLNKVTSKASPAIAPNNKAPYLLWCKTNRRIDKTTEDTTKAVVSKTTEIIWADKAKEPELIEPDQMLTLESIGLKVSLKYATSKKQTRNNKENKRILL